MKTAAFIVVLLVLSGTRQIFAEEGTHITPQVSPPERKDVLMNRKGVLENKMQLLQTKLTGVPEDKQELLMQRKAAFKAQLQTLKNEQKKTIAENLDTKLQMINKNRTDHMGENITKLNEILSKLEQKKIEAQTNGQNVTAVTAAIAAAQQALTTAETAITAQAAKDYTAQVTDETTLRQSFATVLNQLRIDLTATQKTVLSAKDAVKAAAKALRALEVTVTPTVSVTVAPTP